MSMQSTYGNEDSETQYEIHELLELMLDQGASDLHLQVGHPPTLRLHGSMVPVDGPDLRAEDTRALMETITSDAMQEQLKKRGGADFGFAFRGNKRFRVSVLKSKGRYGMVLRTISDTALSFAEIGLPESIKELLSRPRGLILVTGPTGSGKSTTLSAMVNWINENRDGHIITIEDPIEFYHQHKRCVVTQREVGTDTPTFAEALRGALRQDPDVILVGELRDLETMEAAISAAETGHLVLATLHTTGAARTVDRIVDAFPEYSKDQIRTQLASSIVAVISQVLLKQKDEGRVAAFEIMVTTSSIAALIRDNKTFRIQSEIQTGSRFGMITLDAYLASLVTRGLILPEVAMEKAQHPNELKQTLLDAGITLPET